MAVETVAIMAPGHMGHAIGAHLAKAGLRVITNLEGRSSDTKARAARAGTPPNESTTEPQGMVLASFAPIWVHHPK